MGLCFPFIQQALGPWSFAPFGIVLLLTFGFTYLYLPETHGRTVEDIQRLVGKDGGFDDDFQNAVQIVTSIEQDDF